MAVGGFEPHGHIDRGMPIADVSGDVVVPQAGGADADPSSRRMDAEGWSPLTRSMNGRFGMDVDNAARLARLRAEGSLTDAEYDAAMLAASPNPQQGSWSHGAVDPWQPQGPGYGPNGTGWHNGGGQAPWHPQGGDPSPQGVAPPSWGWQPSGPGPQHGGYPPNAGPGAGGWAAQPAAPQPGRTDDSWLPPYYQHRFRRFDVQGRVSQWNWAAFWGGALWYLVKGMWGKALIYILITVLSGGWLAIPVWIYGALFGSYDYYQLHRHGKQF